MEFQDWLDEVTIEVERKYSYNVSDLMAKNVGDLSVLYDQGMVAVEAASTIIENEEEE